MSGRRADRSKPVNHASNSSASSGSSQYVLLSRCIAFTSASKRLYLGAPGPPAVACAPPLALPEAPLPPAPPLDSESTSSFWIASLT
jgi:hypothetical protein